MAKLPERDLQTLWNRLKDVYEYFKSRGIPDKIIAGILGNAGREGSGFWDNVTNSIKDKLGKIHYFYGGVLNELATYDWVNTNYGGYTKQHQIQYIADGILGKLPEIKSDRGRLLNSRFNRFMNKASKSNSPSEIAAYWESIYEVAGKSKLDERQQCAEYFYKLMQKSNSGTKPSNKLNKSKSLPNWSNPDFSKVSLPNKNPYYDFTSENTELDYPTYNLDNIKTEFDLPVYASNFKRGGKLIKKGQQGVKLHKTIYLKKDGNEPESPHSELKSWIPDITPEERMDLTVQELSNGLSTYLPTKEQKQASEGIYHPKRITDWLGLVPVVLPAAITAGVTLPEWGPAALTTVTNPTFWGELIKDTGTYIVADAASQGLTGKRVGAHVNNAIGLEEDHPVGEFIGFGGTSMLRRPIQLMGKTTYQSIRGAILPEYALSLTMDLTLWKPYVSRVVGENGKIRLRLHSHSDKMPREIVLEPLGNNKFYVHIRTWDGEKIPASLSERDKGYLYEALYNELPEGAEILFPESGPGNYATRGTVAALHRLARDHRYTTGDPGVLLYDAGKNGQKTVRLYRATGTSGEYTPSLDGTKEFSGLWFTIDPRKAQRFASMTTKRANMAHTENPVELLYVDIPESELEAFKAENILKGRTDIEYEPTEDYLIPPNFPRARVQLSGYSGNILKDTRLPLPELLEQLNSLGLFRGTSFIKTPIYKTKNINLIQGYKTVIPRFIKNVKNSDMAAKTERTLGAIPTVINPKKVKIFAKSPELLDNIPIYHLKDFSTKELATLLNQWAKEAAKGPYSPNYDFYLGLNKGENLSLDFLSARDLLSMEKLAERYGKYLSTRYNQLLEKITDPVLRHIVEVSPLYMEEVYALLMNVGKATPEFVKELIKRSNSYRRFMSGPFSAEDFSTFKGHSIWDNNMGSIDVEGRIVSGDYGPFPAYFEGLPNLTGDFSTWWDQRIPQGVNVRRGMHDSDIAGTKLINKIYNNKNLRHTNTISVMQIFNKNYTGPRGFIDWPVHLQFYGPRGTQLPNFRVTVSRPPEGFKFGKGYKLGGKLVPKK